MDPKILFASFCLVFLAELGDKTQLTALAFATSSRSPWSVFLGTACALVCAAALAVICGEGLARIVPARVLQLASAILFVLVGLALLVRLAWQPGEENAQQGSAASALAPTGALASFVGQQARAFEEDLAAFIRESAARVSDPRIQTSLMKLADAHLGHARQLAGIQKLASGPGAEAIEADLAKGDPQRLIDTLKKSGSDLPEDDPLGQIIAHQEAAAEFYITLAKRVRFHDARDMLRNLAMEEIRLAQELCALVNHGTEDDPTSAGSAC